MLPLKITLEGFRSFNDLELDLPVGCVSLSGANGAGKSTIVDAIDVALFGPDGRSFDPYLVKGAGELRLELEFEHAGGRYLVRRTFNGRRATLDFERLTISDELARAADELGIERAHLESITQGSAAETQAELERLLGLTRETFRASALLKQGQGGAFTEASPKDRKQILAAALALNVWDEAALAVGADRRAHEGQLQALNGRRETLVVRVRESEGLDARVDSLTADLAVADGELSQSESTLEAATAAVAELERDSERRGAASDALGAAIERHDRQAEAIAQAAAAGAGIAAARDELERLRSAVERLGAARTALEVAVTAQAARGTALARLADLAAAVTTTGERHEELDRRLRDLDATDDVVCPTCRQPLGPGAREHARETLRADVAGAAERWAEALRRHEEAKAALPREVNDLDELRARVADLEGRTAEFARAESYVAELERKAANDNPESRAALVVLAADVVAKRDALEALPPYDDEVVGLRKRHKAQAIEANGLARRRQQAVANDLAGAKALLERAKVDRTELAIVERDAGRLLERNDDLEVLAQAFGRDGVPAWIVEQHALPAIEAEANRILEVLGGPVDRVELRTERELKTGGTRADALDIVCITRTGDRDYATFSGGERTRVNLALRIALARLLAHRRDADVRMLAIDEPDGLDEQGMSALSEVLRDLVMRGEFTTTLLASHVPALRDAFDVTIEVDRDELGSRAVVA